MYKADFYVGTGQRADWIGSVRRNGDIWNIPPILLLQVSKIMFEELAIDFINEKQNDGIVANHICEWPWDWSDSRMTDFSYLFIPEYEKVYMSIDGGDLLDPVKIIQGKSMIDAMTYLGPPTFPVMVEQISLEELIDGPEFTSLI